MTRTARSMKRALDAKLVKYNLTATQYIVLMKMWEQDGISITELGERLYFDNPTLTGIVDRMERDGLLQRQRNDEDRRVVNLYLTTKGKGLQPQLERLAEETDTEAWTGFTESQKKQILDHHERIWKNLNDGSD